MTKQDAPTTTDGRAEFEAFVCKKWGFIPPTMPATGEYADTASEDLWETWQAARASSAAAQWLPIESAPRDGTPVLVYHNRMVIEAWYSAKWGKFVQSETGGTNGINPAHWMPLPAPPAKPDDTAQQEKHDARNHD